MSVDFQSEFVPPRLADLLAVLDTTLQTLESGVFVVPLLRD